MTQDIETPIPAPAPEVSQGPELPPLGGRNPDGKAAVADQVKKRVRKPRAKPATPEPEPTPPPVTKCSPEKAREAVNLVFGLVDPLTNAMAERMDPAAKAIDPAFTFRLAGEERQRIEAVAVDCVQTLPDAAMPPWLPWVVLAVVAGGSAWSRYSMVRQIKAANKAPEVEKVPAP